MKEDELIRRFSADLQDSYDEELEMEIEDRHPLAGRVAGAAADARPTRADAIFASCSGCRPSW